MPDDQITSLMIMFHASICCVHLQSDSHNSVVATSSFMCSANPIHGQHIQEKFNDYRTSKNLAHNNNCAWASPTF